VVHEIDFLSKMRMDSTQSPWWRLATWI